MLPAPGDNAMFKMHYISVWEVNRCLYYYNCELFDDTLLLFGFGCKHIKQSMYLFIKTNLQINHTV